MTEAAHEDYSRYLLKRSPFGRFYRDYWLYPRLCRYFCGDTLDIGCGIGDMLAFHARTIGVDINEHNVEVCRCRGLDARVMDKNRLPFDDRAFDSILLDNVLEHIADPSPLLEEIWRVLRAEGRLVVGVPGIRGQNWDPDHKMFYDEAALEHLAGRHRFRIARFLHMPIGRSAFLSRRLRQYCVYSVWVPSRQRPIVEWQPEI